MGLTSARLRERRLHQPAAPAKPRALDPQEHIAALRAECVKLRAANARLTQELAELTAPQPVKAPEPAPETTPEPVEPAVESPPVARPAPEVIQARPTPSWQNKAQPKRRG